MKLEDAIAHAQEKAVGSSQCAKEHAALAEWLIELSILRNTAKQAPQQEAQEPMAHDEDLLERLYWDFDSQRKKTGEERLAFKGKMRSYASEFRRRSVGQMVFAQSVSDDMMNLADRLGDLPYVDPRAWRHLLVYAPQQAPAPLSDAQIKELIEDGVFLGNCKEIVRAIEHAHGITGDGK